MSNSVPPLDPQSLLPPLLACIGLAFSSPRPPPALIELLSPTLKQKVALLSQSNTTSDGQRIRTWLPLLCWSVDKGTRLVSVVENLTLEPHPVSGEIELPTPLVTKYRRFDVETLRARIEIEEWNLCPIYVYCKEQGGWKVTELLASSDAGEEGEDWDDTVDGAEKAFMSRPAGLVNGHSNGTTSQEQQGTDVDDDEDDEYWAAYDKVQGETPSRSPAPGTVPVSNTGAAHLAPPTGPGRGTGRGQQSEEDYYARYAAEGGGTIDARDDEEETQHAAAPVQAQPPVPRQVDENIRNPVSQPSLSSFLDRRWSTDEHTQPHPQGHAHTISDTTAASMASLNPAAQESIRTHIRSTVRNLLSLAAAQGLDREEVLNLVREEIGS